LPQRRKLTQVNRLVDLPDGRSLELHDAGDPGGLPVIVHHGTPGSGVLYERWASEGVRLIGFDRAGYGGSVRDAGRAIAGVAADVEAVADALELERFATWGSSGGGPHALACAALCGNRLTAAASLAGVAPWGAEGLDWLAGMGEDNVKEFDLVLAGEETLRPAIERDRAELREATTDDLRQALDTLLGEADRAALTGSLAAWQLDSIVHGIRDSGDGWIDDNLAFVAAWGFDPAAIDRPVLIVQGGDDRFVPKSHGAWLAAHVPGNEAWLDDAHGHLTILEDLVPDVHAWLLAHS
jgi:pimeloyl-ACP methyl ester carboxylesterase